MTILSSMLVRLSVRALGERWLTQYREVPDPRIGMQLTSHIGYQKSGQEESHAQGADLLRARAI